ncbi:MAG TPA: glycosyltransferase [Anaerolineales bacterium]|nr:glycosyltransferase [Anaerolineales bacterium]
MKIIIVSQTYSNGNGQASFTIQLAESLAQRGNQVMVITPSNQLRPVSCIQNGVRVEVIPALHASLIHPYIYVTPFPAFQIRKLMREFQPDVVHIQDHYLLCNSAVNEAHKMNIPVIGTNHFLPENLLPFLIKFPNLQYLLSFPLWKMMLAVFNKLDLATTPTETAARILRKQQIHVPVRAISNGVDTERFHPDPQADCFGVRRKYHLAPELPLFLYIGRLDGEKRLDTVLEAVALLPERNFQLAIGGKGPYEQMLRKHAQALGLEGRVVFIGFVQPDDLPALYNSADIFIMPSPEELQSIATLEAMACGKPILAVDARALPELVTPGVNGYLFERNNPEAAAQGMDRLLREREKWDAMGQASFKYAQEHSLRNTISHFEDSYRHSTEKVHMDRRIPSMTRRILNKFI